MTGYPNVYDWDDDQEHGEAGDRLKRHRRDAEQLLNHPDMHEPENQKAIKQAIDNLDRQLEHWSASRRRRRAFQRIGLIPKE